ncbi:MAG: hypothetical protein SFU27_02805 [Thermonemataceae bacterium]|nr:hypothetical protein [Thermonemataceae bacterium]
MKKLLLFVCAVFVSIHSNAQIHLKEMERPELLFSIELNKRAVDYQLENLYLSKDSLSIRVWMGGSVLNITKNKNIQAQFITSIYHSSKSQRVWKKHEIDVKTTQELYNFLMQEDIYNIPHSIRGGIDGTTYFFEVATPSKYRMYSYWSPRDKDGDSLERKVSFILQSIHQKVKSAELYNNFYESLEAGNYMYGMMQFLTIERFLPEDSPKSELYQEIEKIIKTEFEVNEKTSVRAYPKILIDHRPVFLKDLNWIARKDVESIQALKEIKPEMTALYGDVSNGLILIQTYQHLKQVEAEKKAIQEWNKKHQSNTNQSKKKKKGKK